MYTCSTSNNKLPEWYTLERTAEKSIERLNTLKELDYYLNHPDDRLRRLAILRIVRLRLKDSLNRLKEMLDEPMETPLNKDLAAWAIKNIAARLDIDLFISHRLLTRFTGNESYNDLYKITIDENIPSPSFNFSSLPEEYNLKLKSADILSAQSNLPNMVFDSKNWMSLCFKSLCISSKKSLMNFMSKSLNLIKTAAVAIPSIPGKIFSRRIRKAKIKASEPVHVEEIIRQKHEKKAPEFNKLIKKVLFEMLYILLFPVRIILKFIKYMNSHKIMIFAGIAAIYCFFTFSSIGRITAIKYLGIDPYGFHNSAVENIKRTANFALLEFKDITGTVSTKPATENAMATSSAASPNTEYRIYTVTAQNGLNIRVSPSSSAAKAGDTLENSVQVSYLNKSQKDSGGRLWYYIESSAGVKGWVYSGGLKEKESAQ